MPTEKQRRQAAQRHLQKQLERRAEQTARRRRNLGILATVVSVLVVLGAVALLTGVFDGDDPTDTAADSAREGFVECTYLPDTSGNPDLTDTPLPPTPESTPDVGTEQLVMNTEQGEIGLTLDRSSAPCAAASFVHLAGTGFFDGSVCHRMVNQPTFGVLQCGDPSGTGRGGPSYKFDTETTADTTYPRGTIAMANSGTPGSTGSQFFLVFADAQLPPDYSVVGTVDEAGLAVLDTIAAAGNDGSFEPSPGGGAPNVPVTITSMQVV